MVVVALALHANDNPWVAPPFIGSRAASANGMPMPKASLAQTGGCMRGGQCRALGGVDFEADAGLVVGRVVVFLIEHGAAVLPGFDDGAAFGPAVDAKPGNPRI